MCPGEMESARDFVASCFGAEQRTQINKAGDRKARKATAGSFDTHSPVDLCFSWPPQTPLFTSLNP